MLLHGEFSEYLILPYKELYNEPYNLPCKIFYCNANCIHINFEKNL